MYLAWKWWCECSLVFTLLNKAELCCCYSPFFADGCSRVLNIESFPPLHKTHFIFISVQQVPFQHQQPSFTLFKISQNLPLSPASRASLSAAWGSVEDDWMGRGREEDGFHGASTRPSSNHYRPPPRSNFQQIKFCLLTSIKYNLKIKRKKGFQSAWLTQLL